MRRGFTLVELAIVVAIVGVLSVVAVVGYRKLVLTGKVSEAQNVISAIRIAQEDYKVERGIYADIGSGPCPRSGLTQVKTQWDPACSGGKNQWNLLPVHVDGPVQFGYSTVAPPEAIPATVAWVDTSKADLTKPWYVIYAVADLDGNGGLSTELVGSSFTNTIFSQNVGQ